MADDAKPETALAEQPAEAKNLPTKKKKVEEPKFMVEFARSELDLIAQMISKEATKHQINLFIYDCQMRGLNPLKKEIHLVIRKSKMPDGSYQPMASHQVGIDGYRKIAERTGLYQGQTKVEYSTNMIKVHGLEAPEWAEVGVYKKSFVAPVFGRVYFAEFVVTKTYQGKSEVMGLWKDKPRHMIAKCAEALALRRAFPDELAGLYIKEEVESGMADEHIEVTEKTVGEPVNGESSVVKAEIQEAPNSKKSFDISEKPTVTVKEEIEEMKADIEKVDPATGWKQEEVAVTSGHKAETAEISQEDEMNPMF